MPTIHYSSGLFGFCTSCFQSYIIWRQSTTCVRSWRSLLTCMLTYHDRTFINLGRFPSLPWMEWCFLVARLFAKWRDLFTQSPCNYSTFVNKTNLRVLIAATGLVILLKFDPIHRFFSLCDLEIWCMTLINNTAPLLYDIKLCVSFQIHRWIQTKVTVRKRSIRVKIGDFLSCVTLKFDGWPWKTIGHLFYTTSSFMQHFVAIGEFKLELQSGNAQSGSNTTIFRAVRPWNLTNDLAKQ